VRMSFISISSSSAGRAGVWQQRHLTAVLDGRRDVTLVLGAVACDATGSDLAAVGDELPQQGGVFVVDVRNLVFAEDANLLFRFAHWSLCHQ
jgi:hypothetical protein